MTDHFRNELKALGEIKSGFAARGWIQATSGNFSLRVKEKPLEFFISVSGRDKSVNLPDDFILVNEQCKPINVKGEPEAPIVLKPSAEAGVHAEIYRKISPGVVLHVHTLCDTVVSNHSPGQDHFLIEGLEMIKGLGLWEEANRVKVAIVPNYHDLAKLAKAVGDAADPLVPGILIQGHGLYAWGNTLLEAKRHVEAFEFLFEYMYLEMLIKGKK